MLPTSPAPAADGGGDHLRADCANCFGLCCVALPFETSADFPINKDAGRPCVNLTQNFGCGIHARLRAEGFKGCTVFECFGAGQKVSQATFEGHDWRGSPGSARQMFDTFAVMRQLHELLWYLTAALEVPATSSIHDALRRALSDVQAVTDKSAEVLATLDVAPLRSLVNALLLHASELIRAARPGRKRNHRGADLMGAKLRNADLGGADLRGAYLIAADLRNADLRTADLIGADLRDADVRGADFSDSIFLTQPQMNAAIGDSTTKLPRGLTRPAHWRHESGEDGRRRQRQSQPPAQGRPIREALGRRTTESRAEWDGRPARRAGDRN